ncbi:hypothetical protein [Bradyrhizobium sp. MOS002]|uniref:hypothetical protein n=1 Tax=Bradyrhizobium sp. MOS002 TaxID=2133947 RepID=UPI000D13850B|nr:hypothetical protein [Bradyrhizobium sp. MOS002]PSO23144.1 hypothetical protein C7G41_33075 [Bradyrhizobium sp. MOS002]
MQKHAPDRRHHRCAPKDMSTFETTPSEVTPEIEEFLATVGKGAPRLVDVDAPPDARAGWCFLNVATEVAAKGGRPLHGWIIWLARGLWLNAEFHVVRQKDNGDLVDVTPKTDGEHKVLFSPDPRDPDFDFFQRPASIRMRIYDHDKRRDTVADLLANFSEIRLSYETQKAAKKGLTLVQSLGMDVKRDRLAKLIDDLLENVGVLESMHVPTWKGMICRDPRCERDVARRVRIFERQKAKLHRMMVAAKVHGTSRDMWRD